MHEFEEEVNHNLQLHKSSVNKKLMHVKDHYTDLEQLFPGFNKKLNEDYYVRTLDGESNEFTLLETIKIIEHF